MNNNSAVMERDSQSQERSRVDISSLMAAVAFSQDLQVTRYKNIRDAESNGVNIMMHFGETSKSPYAPMPATRSLDAAPIASAEPFAPSVDVAPTLSTPDKTVAKSAAKAKKTSVLGRRTKAPEAPNSTQLPKSLEIIDIIEPIEVREKPITEPLSAVAKVDTITGSLFAEDVAPYEDEVEEPEETAAEKTGKIVRKLAATATVATGLLVAGAVSLGLVAPNTEAAHEAASEKNKRVVEQAVDQAAYTYDIMPNANAKTVAIMVGGATEEFAPSDEMIAKGYGTDASIMGLNYPASMGPFVGEKTTTQSVNEGAPAITAQYYKNRAEGKMTEILPYSEGNLVTYAALQQIKANNGGVWPDDLKVTFLNNPHANGAVADGPWGKIGSLFVGQDLTGVDLPPGSTVIYGERDPYATSGKGQDPATDLFNVFLIGVGAHDIQDLNGKNFKEITDKNGVVHRIYDMDVAAALNKLGMGIADTADFNAAVNALFPVNSDPDSTELKKADVGLAMKYGARALDKQIDPSGSFNFFETLQANMPEQWKKLMTDGLNGFNDVGMALGNAMANPTPENIMAALQAVQKTMHTVFGDFSSANSNANIVTGSQNMLQTTIISQIKQYTGLDMTAQVTSFGNQIVQGSTAYIAQTQQLAEAQARIQAAQVKANITASVNQASAAVASTTASTSVEVTTTWNQGDIAAIPKAPAATVTLNGSGASAEVTTPSATSTAAATAAEKAPVAATPSNTVNEYTPAPLAEVAEPASTPASQSEAPAAAPTTSTRKKAAVAPEAPSSSVDNAPVAVAPAAAPAAPAAPAEAAPAPVENTPAPVIEAPVAQAPQAVMQAPVAAAPAEAPAPVVTPPVIEAPAPAPAPNPIANFLSGLGMAPAPSHASSPSSGGSSSPSISSIPKSGSNGFIVAPN